MVLLDKELEMVVGDLKKSTNSSFRSRKMSWTIRISCTSNLSVVGFFNLLIYRDRK